MKLFTAYIFSRYYEVIAENAEKASAIVEKVFESKPNGLEENRFPIYQTAEEYLNHYKDTPAGDIPLMVVCMRYLPENNIPCPRIWREDDLLIATFTSDLLSESFRELYNKWVDVRYGISLDNDNL